MPLKVKRVSQNKYKGGKNIRRPTGRSNLKASVAAARPKNVGMPEARPKRVGGASKGVRRATSKFRMKATATAVKKPTSGAPVARPAKAVRGVSTTGIKKPTQGQPAPPPKKSPVTAKPTSGPKVAPPPKAPAAPKPQVAPKEAEPEIDWPKLVGTLRKDWDFTSEEAAEDLGVAANTFKKWESGEAVPGKANQDKILTAMKTYSDFELKDFRK